MGFSIGGLLDPSGVFTGSQGIAASEEATDISIAEQRRQSDISQSNLLPFLEAGQRQLPGAQDRASLEGFGGGIAELLQGLGPQLQPRIDDLLRESQFALSGSGQLRSGRAPIAAADITSGTLLPEALGAESEIGRRIQQLIAPGNQAGGALGALGVQTGQNISGALTSGNQGALAAAAQGKQNAATGIGALLAAFSDDDLKKDKQKAGTKNGIQLWTWTWKKAAEALGLFGEGFGVMAKDILNKRPDAVHIDESGYFKVNYHKLGLA